MQQFSLQSLLIFVAAVCIISALTNACGPAVGVMASAAFIFGCLTTYGSDGSAGILLGMLTPTALLISFIDFHFGMVATMPHAVVVICLILLMAGPYLYRHSQKPNWILTGCFVFWFAISPLINYTPRKPFVRAYSRVQIGMSMEEARSIVRQQFPDGRPEENASDERLSYRLDPKDGRYNAEIISFTLRNGRVVSKRYSPD